VVLADGHVAVSAEPRFEVRDHDAGSRIQLPISPRVRYGRSAGSTRSGRLGNSICVPSSLLLETMARLQPGLAQQGDGLAGGSISQASWL
jgi:hypothetical protein